MPVEVHALVSKPPAADTRTPSIWMPSVAASRYMSLRTHPATARCNRWAPLKAASTVTPSDVQRCGNWIALASFDLNDPVPTTTSNWSIGFTSYARPSLGPGYAAGFAHARAGGGDLRQEREFRVSTVMDAASPDRA